MRPTGKILEIGFNSHSAAYIQTHKPKSHTIIESDLQVIEKAKKWAPAESNVSIVYGTWQEILPSLGVFDSIVINSNFKNNMKKSISHEEISSATTFLSNEKALYQLIEKEIPTLSNARYSDHDIDEFFLTIDSSQTSETSYFMSQLRQNGQITENQYEQAVQEYQLKKYALSSLDCAMKTHNHGFDLLTECLKNHMEKGSRFASFLSGGISNYEYPQYFDNIITSPHLDYQEKSISLAHTKDHEALAMVIEKLSYTQVISKIGFFSHPITTM